VSSSGDVIIINFSPRKRSPMVAASANGHHAKHLLCARSGSAASATATTKSELLCSHQLNRHGRRRLRAAADSMYAIPPPDIGRYYQGSAEKLL